MVRVCVCMKIAVEVQTVRPGVGGQLSVPKSAGHCTWPWDPEMNTTKALSLKELKTGEFYKVDRKLLEGRNHIVCEFVSPVPSTMPDVE